MERYRYETNLDIGQAEINGPGISVHFLTIEGAKRANHPGSIQNGVLIFPKELKKLLDTAFEQGVREKQREIRHTIGLKD